MKICISSGHGKYIRGASGYPVPPQLDEVDQARRVVDRVADLWRQLGIDVDVFHDNTSHDQNTNLHTIVNHHNAQGPHDLDVSVHFNAYDGSAHGTECLYVTQAALAEKVAGAIAAVGFTNRGPKYRSDLYFLNNTREPAILIEVCFCDNTADSKTYSSKFDDVCQAIAQSISGEELPEEPDEPERPPIEWRPPERPDDEVNKLALTVQCYGDMIVSINGQQFRAGDEPNTPNRATMTIAAEGDLVVSINGQDFHGPFEPSEPGDTEPLFQASGPCSWFGGPNDQGVAPDEGLAFIYSYDAAPHLFLKQQPPGTTGLARRLDTDNVYYVACRWDYDVTPKTMLADKSRQAKVRANGREALAWPADWGPNENTGRVADLSHALLEALDLTTDDLVEVIYPASESEGIA